MVPLIVSVSPSSGMERYWSMFTVMRQGRPSWGSRRSRADVAPDPTIERPSRSRLCARRFCLEENGWDIDDATQDTKDLTVFFRANVAKPDHTILWAFSVEHLSHSKRRTVWRNL